MPTDEAIKRTDDAIERILMGDLADKVAKLRQIEASVETNKNSLGVENLKLVTGFLRAIGDAIRGEANAIHRISNRDTKVPLWRFKADVLDDFSVEERRESDAIEALTKMFAEKRGLEGIDESIKELMRDLFTEFLALSAGRYKRDSQLINALK